MSELGSFCSPRQLPLAHALAMEGLTGQYQTVTRNLGMELVDYCCEEFEEVWFSCHVSSNWKCARDNSRSVSKASWTKWFVCIGKQYFAYFLIATNSAAPPPNTEIMHKWYVATRSATITTQDGFHPDPHGIRLRSPVFLQLVLIIIIFHQYCHYYRYLFIFISFYLILVLCLFIF